jgi:hypothetical protein
MENRNRRLATVQDVFYGTEVHGILTCNIYLDIKGGIQSFGGVNLNKESGLRFQREICSLFGVTDIQQITGKECIALFSFGGYSEPVEGIETIRGRLTLTSFIRKSNPKFKSPLDREKDRLFQEIDRSVQKIIEASKKIETLDETYFDWG